jgi:hypothetical protein
MDDGAGGRCVRVREVAAGGPGCFLTATHLVVEGTDEEIGAGLAEECARWFPPAATVEDKALARTRMRWFERWWPQHAARLRGAAEVFGFDPDRDGAAAEFWAVPFSGGCSALWSPPSTSSDGHGRVARNYDFRTGSVAEVVGGETQPGQPGMTSRPCVIDSRPVGGRAVVVVSAYDLGGCLEGVNDAGLAVVLLADDESKGLQPTMAGQAGVYELQLPRMLLDLCATVDEAKECLYITKAYDQMVACHYLVADTDGNAFVWERDTHNVEHVVDAIAAPLCVTNYLLHRHPDPEATPDEEPVDGVPEGLGPYARGRTLAAVARRAPLSRDDLAAAVDEVLIDARAPGARTLWRSVIDVTARTLDVEFYLGDLPDGSPQRSDARCYTCSMPA